MTTTNTPAAKSGTFRIGGDLVVHRLGYGAMQITGRGVWGPPADREECIRVLRRVPELGIDFIDTADSYGPYISETLIAEALHPYPANLVIATKAGFERTGPNQWTTNGRPEHIRKALDGSLERLRVERIDLYQLHRIDRNVPADEQFGVLKELQDAGKIRHIGLSEVRVADIEKARKTIEITTVQNRYNLVDRQHEDVLDYCEREGIGFIPWYPLLTGKLASARGALSRTAERLGATAPQVALAWLLARSPVMLPIPGTSKVKHLEENTHGAEIALTSEDVKAIDEEVKASAS